MTGANLVRASGFGIVRIKGSHHHLRREGGSLVTVPVHRGEIIYPRGLVHQRTTVARAGVHTELSEPGKRLPIRTRWSSEGDFFARPTIGRGLPGAVRSAISCEMQYSLGRG
ncbi:MAG: type II toxin-antitoxin system HicA family toxin [Bacillota bacterium]